MDLLYEHIDNDLELQFRQRALNELVLSFVKGKTVFEVGCGSGTLLKLLYQKGFIFSGCDPSLIQCRLAKKRLKKVNGPTDTIFQLALADTSKWKKRYFDTIICLDVLEHIKNDKGAMRQLVRLVKPGGRLILVVPALPLLWSRRDVIYGHFRRYTKTKFQELINTIPVRIIFLRYWNTIGAMITFILYRCGLDLDVDYLTVTQRQPLRSVNTLVGLWLSIVEQHILFPFGLSLFAVIEKR